MEKGFIYVDQDGYNELLLEISKIEKKLQINNLEKGEAYSGAVGDGWHDNFAFDDANMKERAILNDLREAREKLLRVKIMESMESDELVDINDIITVRYIYSENDFENYKFKLIAAATGKLDADIPEISINSPLGEKVYKKSIGFKSELRIRDSIFNIEITELQKSSDVKLQQLQRKI